jgi:hypothetical protein
VSARPTLLEGGLVVDGSGGPSWPGDVLLVDDRIDRLGAGLRQRLPAGMAVEDLDVVDCRGLVDGARVHRRPHARRSAIVLADPADAAEGVAGRDHGGRRQLRHLAWRHYVHRQGSCRR